MARLIRSEKQDGIGDVDWLQRARAAGVIRAEPTEGGLVESRTTHAIHDVGANPANGQSQPPASRH